MSRAFFNRFQSRSLAPASPIQSWLTKESQQIVHTAQRYMALEKEIRAFLPPGLQQCQVAIIDGQRLTLAVPSAGHASKLKQLTPRIISHLQQQQWKLNEIQIQIQSVLISGLKPLGYVRQGGAGIGQSGLVAFEKLDKELNLDNGPLHHAIQRLLKRHKEQKTE